LLHRQSRHAGSLPRRAFASGLCLFPLINMRGGASKSANLWLVPCGTRAPRGAPVAEVSGIGPRFPVRASRSWLRRSEAASASPRRASRPTFLRPPKQASRRREAGSAKTQVVSQLLAGTPSGPGGSSNAARVPCCDKARRHRPRPASRRLMRTPLQKDEVSAM